MKAIKYFLKGFISIVVIAFLITCLFAVLSKLSVITLIVLIVMLLSAIAGYYIYLKDSIRRGK